MSTKEREGNADKEKKDISWDSIEKQLQKAEFEDERGIVQFSSFQVKRVKKYSRTIEPLIPDIVLNDPKLNSSLRRYFEYCTRDAELIVVKKPKLSLNLVSLESETKKITKSDSARKSQESTEFIPELEELSNALKSISYQEDHLLTIKSFSSSKLKVVSKSNEFGSSQSNESKRIISNESQIPSVSSTLTRNVTSHERKASPPITVTEIHSPKTSTSQSKSTTKILKRSTSSASPSSRHALLRQRKDLSSINLKSNQNIDSGPKTITSISTSSKRPRASSDPEVTEESSTSYLNGGKVHSISTQRILKKENEFSTTTSVIFPHATSDRMFLLLKCEGLSFDHGGEPFLCSIALYDLRERSKLSEDFYFVVKSQDFKVLDMSYTVQWNYIKPTKKTRSDEFDEFEERNKGAFEVFSPSQAVFSLARGVFNVAFLLRIHRLVLSVGDEKEIATSFYSKPIDPTDSKFKKLQEELSKLLNNAKELLWTPFGFSLIPVYQIGTSQLVTSHQTINPVLSPRGKEKEFTNLLREIYGKIFLEMRHIDDSTIFELINTEDILRHKVISGHFMFTLEQIDNVDNLKYRIDSSLRFVASKPPKEALPKVVKEIEDFSMPPLPKIDYTCNLYVYPQQTIFGKTSNIKVQMQVKADDNPNSKPLPVIYNREKCGFVDTISCMFLVNKTSPCHFDELKIRLPPLTPHHHLLFTFLHLESLHKQVILGYVVVPLLYKKSVIPDNEYTFTIMRELPKDYLKQMSDIFDKKASKLQTGTTTKENKKMSFTFRTRLVSSFYVKDKILKDFFEASESYTESLTAIASGATNDKISDRLNTLSRSIEQLNQLPKEVCVKWFPRIFNELMRLMVLTQYDISATDNVMMNAFIALITLIKRLREQTLVNTEMLLTNYLNYIFEVSSLRLVPSSESKNEALHQTKEKDKKTKLKSEHSKGKEAESMKKEQQFLPLPFYACFVKAWLDVMKYKEGAFSGFTSHWFLFDLLVKAIVLELNFNGSLSLTSRIGRFSKEFKQNIEALVNYYVQEKWVKIPQFPSIIIAIGTFFNKLFKVMDRGFVFAVLHRFLLVLNSLEKKYPNVAEDKWNLLKIVTRQNEDYIALNHPQNKPKLSSSFSITSASLQQHFLATTLITELFNVFSAPAATQKQAIQLFKNVLFEFENFYYSPQIKEQIANMYFAFITKLPEVVDFIIKDPGSVGEWLLCWFHLLKTCSSSLIVSWIKQETQRKLYLLLKFFSTALSLLHDNHQLREACTQIRFITFTYLLKIIGVRRIDLNDTSNLLLGECINVLHFLLNIPHNPIDSVGDHKIVPKELHPRLEKRKSSRRSMKHILKLSSTESAFLIVVFKCIHFVITNYAKVIFWENEGNTYIQLLSYGLLYYCSMSHSEIASITSQLFSELIQFDYTLRGNIQRIRLQSVIAMSKLVGDRKILSVKALEKSLNAILQKFNDLTNQTTQVQTQERTDHGEKSGVSLSSEFVIAVKELIQNLITVALYHDRIINSNIAYDPATLVDFYYNIAKGSSDSPDLRISWLLNIAKLQLDMGNFVETGMCYLHTASLIGQYLVNTKQLSPLIADEVVKLSPNIRREEPLQNVQNVEVSNLWSINKYAEYLLLASNFFQKGQMYELSISLYTTLCKIFASHKNYNKLSEAAKLLDNVTILLMKEEEERRRLYYNYYRVEFYGDIFGELHGKSFIYRQSESVNLLDFRKYLENQFRNYSLTFLEASDSEISKMLSSKSTKELCHVRILSVEPHFTAEEMSERLTPFEKHTNINKFKVEVPFTTDGRSQAESLIDQYLKKITYTVEMTFPFVKNRLLVSHKQETILTPIENAQWILIRQIQRLEEAIQLNPVHKPTLQLLLQGSIVPMVNRGPAEIANLFLTKESLQKFDPSSVQSLRRTMEDFLVACEAALKLHKSIVSSEKEYELQKIFEEHFQTLSEQIKRSEVTLNEDDKLLKDSTTTAETTTTKQNPNENITNVIPQSTIQQIRARRKKTLDSRVKELYQTWKETNIVQSGNDNPSSPRSESPSTKPDEKTKENTSL